MYKWLVPLVLGVAVVTGVVVQTVVKRILDDQVRRQLREDEATIKGERPPADSGS
jgi:hypothetical protein